MPLSASSDADALASIPLRDRRTVVGHACLDLMSPLSENVLAALVAEVPDGGRLLDMGCGKAALARRLLAVDPAASALGVERNPLLAAQGEALAEREGVRARLEIVVADAGDWRTTESFDAIALLGSSHALGSLQDVVDYARARLRTGGVLLLGEGIWTAQPDPEYLQFLGTDGSDMLTEDALAGELQSAGFGIRYRHVSSAEEWDAYEGPYFSSLKAYSDPSGGRPFLEEAEMFEAMQVKYGRKAMGFMAAAAVKQ